MNTECFPNRAFCQIHNHGGIASANANLPNSTKNPAQGSGYFVYTQSRKAGKALQAKGLETMARGFESMPPKKEWTQYSKHEHYRIKTQQKSNPMSVRKVSSKTFDYRPSTRKGTAQYKHFRRQPRTGKYSRPPPGRIKLHRARKVTLGGTLYGAGKALPYLGAGFYIYDVATDDKPVQRLIKDATWAITNPLDFAYEASGAGTLQRTTFSGEEQRVKNINYRTEALKSIWSSIVD